MNFYRRLDRDASFPASPQSSWLKGAPAWQAPSATLRLRTFAYLVMIDLLALALSFGIAGILRGSLVADLEAMVILAAILPIYLVIAMNGGAYSADIVDQPFRAAARGVKAFLVAVAALTVSVFFLKSGESFSRLAIGVGTVLALATIATGRYFFVRNLPRIVGGDPYGTALIWESGQPIPDVAFSVTIAADALMTPGEQDDPSKFDRIARALVGVHNVVVSCSPAHRDAWTHALKGANIQGEILMPELNRFAPLGTTQHGIMTALVIARGPLNLIERATKRAFDVSVAMLALIALSPLMLAVAIAIKLDSPGPILFKQNRLGRANRVFRVAKFRSMRSEAADKHGARSASRADDRVTRVGRFIRRTSIDELPQLLNVLAGTMSIVGPRPHALGSRAADKLFWEVDGRYWHRHAAKPGLTGLAQVRGYRGATVEEVDLTNRLQADLEYLDTWTIWRDVQIIAQTLRVLIHRNAF